MSSNKDLTKEQREQMINLLQTKFQEVGPEAAVTYNLFLPLSRVLIRHPNNSDAIRGALVNSVKRLGLRLNFEELSTAFYAL
jgi:hypothetical protein